MVERDEGRGQHVVGQPFAEVVEEFGGIEPAEHRPVVGDQAVAGRGEHGGGFGDADVGKQGGIDLAKLHPEAADLHLAVDAAEAFQRAIRQPSGEVAGAVEARQVGVVNEGGIGEIRAFPIAEREAAAAEVELAGDAGWERHAIGRKDQHAGVRDGVPDADEVGIFRDAPEGGPDGGLGGAVEVPRFLAEGGEAAGEREVERFAAAEQAEAVGAGPAGIEQHAPGGRGGLHDVGLRGLDAGDQRGGIAGGLAIDEIDGAAGDEREEKLQRGDVEGHGGQREESFAVAEAGLRGHREQEIRQRAVGNDDALRPAGGAGGVEDVGGVGRAGRRRELGVRRFI